MLKIGKQLMRFLIINYVCTFLILSPTVKAFAGELDYTVQYLPKGISCVFSSARYRCFTLEESKELIKIDHYLFVLEHENKDLKSMVTNISSQLTLKNKQLELHYDNYLSMQGDRDRLSIKWEKTDEDFQNARADKDFWKSLTFIGTGVGILVGIIGGLVLSKELN